jgi:hypothetical protein
MFAASAAPIDALGGLSRAARRDYAPAMAAPTTLDLQRGRTLLVDTTGDDDLVELRAPSGTVEIRLRITDDGPVLELESVRLALRAARSIDVDAPEFSVSADEITLSGKTDVRVDAGGDVHVTGETIRLN